MYPLFVKMVLLTIKSSLFVTQAMGILMHLIMKKNLESVKILKNPLSTLKEGIIPKNQIVMLPV